MVVRQPLPASALSETESDDAPAPTAMASTGQDDASPARYTSKGLRINVNGVVSMRELDLTGLVPPKTRDAGAKRFHNASGEPHFQQGIYCGELDH